MKCDFSETQFAFCFTFEILKNYPNLVMPQFPNTVQEGRRGGGYDVAIDGSIFIQFKIPNYHKRKNDYKIKIDTECKQHALLKELKKPANCVYYAAPKFHTSDDLEKFYNSNLIERNSALFSIEDFPNNAVHKHVTFSRSGTQGTLHSNKESIDISQEIFSCKSSSSYLPDPMLLPVKAGYILDFIKNVDPAINTKYGKEKIVNEVFSILLIKYNILWISYFQ